MSESKEAYADKCWHDHQVTVVKGSDLDHMLIWRKAKGLKPGVPSQECPVCVQNSEEAVHTGDQRDKALGPLQSKTLEQDN